MKLNKDLSNSSDWFDNYFKRYQIELYKAGIQEKLIEFYEHCLKVKADGNQLFFAGNGASAAIASHAAVDFTKQGKIVASTFNDADLITCFANDFGYENWIAQSLAHYAKPGDSVILISCSGKSPNVVNASKYAKEAGINVISFTGFDENNPLKNQSDISFWVDSKAYNIIEGIHMIWMTTVVDMLVGNAEYSA